jgi:hypothetical protein
MGSGYGYRAFVKMVDEPAGHKLPTIREPTGVGQRNLSIHLCTISWKRLNASTQWSVDTFRARKVLQP